MMKGLHMHRTVRFGIVALLAAATTALASPGLASTRHSYASLGTQLCSGSGPFIYFVEADVTAGSDQAVCYDGTTTPVPLGGARNAGYLAALDNQSGRRIFLSGTNLNGESSYSYCFDRGYDWALGPPDTGGQIQQHLQLDKMTLGSTTVACPAGNPVGDGTTDPGAPQADKPGCVGSNHLPTQGGHVFVIANPGLPKSDPVFTTTDYACVSGAPGSTAVSAVGGNLWAVVNGSSHSVLVSGPGMTTACVDSNHAITPVSAKDSVDAATITVTSDSGTCP